MMTLCMTFAKVVIICGVDCHIFKSLIVFCLDVRREIKWRFGGAAPRKPLPLTMFRLLFIRVLWHF